MAAFPLLHLREGTNLTLEEVEAKAWLLGLDVEV